MTLIVSLRGKNGLVLSADSRGTIGDPRSLTAINDDQIKLFRLSKYCGVGISGSSEFAAKVLDELKNEINDSDLADAVLKTTREVARRLYDDWFEKFPLEKRPSMTLTVVGYDKNGDDFVPRTYLLVSHSDFAPHLFPTGNCLAGVPQYAVYLLHRLYDPQMDVADLSRLAAYLISETATQDPKVGGPIRIATITESDGFRQLDANEVREIMRKNNEQTEQMKQSFFGSKQ